MLLIALRNILQEKGRLLISLLGVTSAVILMLLLLGIYSGAIKQFTRFIEENPTDAIVLQKGVSDYFHGASLIPEDVVRRIQLAEGVKEAVPMIAQTAVIQQDDKKYDVFLTSFVNNQPLGAPWDVIGNNEIDNSEIIISSTLADKLGKKLGDRMTVANQDFTINGLVPDATSFGTNYAWITLNKAKEMVTLPVVSFIYVKAENPHQSQQLINRLSQQYPEQSVLGKEQFLDNNQAELEEVFLPIIGAIAGIAIIVGTAIIGLTIYTATIDKIREYGVLKAIGVSNRQLFKIVSAQSFILVALGFIVGTIASLLLASGLTKLIGIPPIITLNTVLGVGALSLVMATIAAFAPLRRLLSIDPAEVFKS